MQYAVVSQQADVCSEGQNSGRGQESSSGGSEAEGVVGSLLIIISLVSTRGETLFEVGLEDVVHTLDITSGLVVHSVPVVLVDPAIESVHIAGGFIFSALDFFALLNGSDDFIDDVDKLVRGLVDLVSDEIVVLGYDAINLLFEGFDHGVDITANCVPHDENLSKNISESSLSIGKTEQCFDFRHESSKIDIIDISHNHVTTFFFHEQVHDDCHLVTGVSAS